MAELTFNRLHKNGWLSYKVAGVAGAVFIDSRMLTKEFVENPPETLDLAISGLLPPNTAITDKQKEKAAKKAENDGKKAERAKASAEKAQARLKKLQDAATKAQARVTKAAGSSGVDASDPT